MENEFGSNPTRSLGAYRVSETIGGLTVPTIGWTNQGSHQYLIVDRLNLVISIEKWQLLWLIYILVVKQQDEI